ncbi:unnamed protein product (macronuclear) [Paramecium tetraurelia]|uniref:CRAL-TRIO domain-containing protein n=1 Tax=Paramecium tetraurelia TaxID=5888 RepID=A0D463_PARTE|nr:uncharacterized protein GSPATT00013296001 [Paramecium tetraurelia]CAK77830.1 unnamed protein product [Paramecium tetraurelia]|eukprot:XP_001445227.1 hypothetical protein (macronuclear) [Paramecium tetraurelia strain d4-2]
MIGYLRKENLIEPGCMYFQKNQAEKVIVAGKIERKIFENIEMEPFEKEQLKNLKQALINHPPLRLPKEWQDSDYQRILAYCDHDIANTIQVLYLDNINKVLRQHLNWRNKINLEIPPEAILLNGAIYIHGHDKRFRPVIIINTLKALKYKLQEFREGFDYLFTMLIRDVLISYYVESTIILVDMSNLDQSSLPITNEVINFVKNCEYNFYGRIHKIYIIEDFQNWQCNQLLQILKPESQDKVVFLQKKNLSQLTNQIEENQLESKYLGLQPDIQTNFWQIDQNLIRPPKDLSPNKTEKKDKKEEAKTVMSYTDEFISKSQFIIQRSRPESSQNSQLFLQVYNEEQEVVLSESHLIELADSINNILEYFPDSQFQSSQHNYKGIDSAPLQSTTIKPRDLQKQESEIWSGSEVQMSSNLVLQNQKRDPCCQNSSICQLI